MALGTHRSLSEELQARIAEGRASEAYRAYERTRDWVLELRSSSFGEDVERPSEYWTEELETLDYMLDASPLVIEKLRQHTYTVTGIRAYDYRRGKNSERLAEKLSALVELGGRELLVPEPRLLGGFGFEIDGSLYNIDTLKYYEALIALERGAVLGGFRAATRRRVVVEIGPGWGGFPYQFRSLFPDVTYVLVDLPELFLFSATYLQAAFPDARTIFLDAGRSLSGDEWLDYDFVFVPNTHVDRLTPPHLDLTVNMVSFQEMTAAQVDGYVREAFELGSPFLYSLNRERSFYNEELESVTDILERYYWPRVVPVLPVAYTNMLESKKKTEKRAAKRSKQEPQPTKTLLDYKHVLGTRRVAP